MENLKNKKVLVMGLAKSGLAAIKVLHKEGALITLSEIKPVDELPEKDLLNEIGVRVIPQDEQSLKEGFDLVVKNPGIPPINPLVLDLKKRNIPVITEIELAYVLSKKQHYFAITGTNGKTTTTTLLYEILKSFYKDKALTGGNIGTPLCDLALQYDLFENEGYYISLEISNHQLVDVDTFHPEQAVIINLTPDHLSTMGSLDNYYKSKTEVYRNMKAEDIYLMNKDDDLVNEYLAKYPTMAKKISFSIQTKDADSYADEEEIVILGKKLCDVKDVKIVGRHNLQNIVIASTMAVLAGVPMESVRETVLQFRGVEHRIEFVREYGGVKYYNDSKGTNTDATITALKAFDSNVILLVGGYEKGLDMTEMRKHLGCVKQVIAYGAAGKRIGTDLVGSKAIFLTDLNEAVTKAHEIAENGDIVLLSPTTSSFDQYHSYEERGRHFKQLVNRLQ